MEKFHPKVSLSNSIRIILLSAVLLSAYDLTNPNSARAQNSTNKAKEATNQTENLKASDFINNGADRLHPYSSSPR